jgi:hypothetical protein
VHRHEPSQLIEHNFDISFDFDFDFELIEFELEHGCEFDGLVRINRLEFRREFLR